MRRWPLTLVLAGSISGCAHDAVLPVVQPPVALHMLPGRGLDPNCMGPLYLAVFTQDVRSRPLLPQLTEIVASELRNAAPVEIILVLDRGYDCEPCSDWSSTCGGFGLPMRSADPQSAVVICELQELDAYPPLRVGMSLQVRRLIDGAPLAGSQGIWDSQPVPTVVESGFHWPWKKRAPLEPPVELNWSQFVESGSMIALMRRAARDSVQSILCATTASVGEPGPHLDEPFLPPTLPPAVPDEGEFSDDLSGFIAPPQDFSE